MLAAELLDNMAEELDRDDKIVIDAVGIVVAVNVERDDEAYSQIHYRCSDARRWVQYGLFSRVAEISAMNYRDADE